MQLQNNTNIFFFSLTLYSAYSRGPNVKTLRYPLSSYLREEIEPTTSQGRKRDIYSHTLVPLRNESLTNIQTNKQTHLIYKVNFTKIFHTLHLKPFLSQTLRRI